GLRAFLRDERRPVFLPVTAYGIALYGVMTLVFTFPSGRGSMLHSSAALLPWLAIAAVEGIERTVSAVAARRTHWVAPRATRNFTLILLAASVAVSIYAVADEARGWRKQVDAYAAIAPVI